MKTLTQAELKRQLHYDPETGVFTRKVSATNSVKVGDKAGNRHIAGYLDFGVNGKKYLAHRLAWLYIHGYLPEHEIDHKNGKRDDNRICNLREASRMCNMQNTKTRITNKSGFPGVCLPANQKKWRAQVKIKGKSIFLGHYKTGLDAALARLTMEIWHPQWTCNHRSELVKTIKQAWPEFNEKCLE